MLLSAMAVSALASCGGSTPATTTEQTTQATTSAESAASSKTESSSAASAESVHSEEKSEVTAEVSKKQSEEIVESETPSEPATTSEEEIESSEEVSSVEELSSEEVEQGLPLNKSGGDHVTLTFFDASKTRELTSGAFGQSIYVRAVAESSRYEIRSVSYFYYYGSLSTKYEGNLSFDDDGFAPFTVPVESRGVSESGITFVVKELDKEKYVGQDFVGNYISVDFGSGNGPAQYKQLTGKTTSIDASGTLTFGNKVAYISEIRDDGLYTENYSTLPNDEGFLLFNDYSSISSPFNYNYDILALKKENDTDADSEYSVKGERFVLDQSTYIVVSFFHNGAPYKNALIDVTKKKATFGVDVNYVYGESLVDDKVFYEVSKGGDTLLRVTFTSGGGVSCRAEATATHGEYEGNNSKMLIVINDVFAIYDGGEYAIKITDNTAVLTNGTKMITLTLNVESKTFDFVKEEEDARTAPNFRGLTFNGTFIDGWGDDNQGAVAFDSYESDAQITGTIWYGPINQTWAHPFGFTATYDLATNSLAMTIVSEKYNEGAIGKTISAICEDGKMTFVGNLTSYYTCNNAVFTCSDFVL